jgi:hypothetical protein
MLRCLLLSFFFTVITVLSFNHQKRSPIIRNLFRLLSSEPNQHVALENPIEGVIKIYI